MVPPPVGGGVSPLAITEVGRQALPVNTAVGRAHQVLVTRQKFVWISGGPHQRLIAGTPEPKRTVRIGGDIHQLAARVGDLHDPLHPAHAVDNLRVEWIGDDGPEFICGCGIPVEHRDGAELPATAHRDGAGILLTGVHPVRERVVDRDPVDLGGRLVVPGAPGVAAIERDRGALIDAEELPVTVGGVDPELLRIVAAGSALVTVEGFAAVERSVTAGAHRVDDVGILGMDPDAVQIISSDDAPVGRGLVPGCAAVVGTVETESADDEHPLRIGVHGDGNGGSSGHGRKSGAVELRPRGPFIGRLVD